jgi:hypothetical protein
MIPLSKKINESFINLAPLSDRPLMKYATAFMKEALREMSIEERESFEDILKSLNIDENVWFFNGVHAMEQIYQKRLNSDT